MLNKPSSGVFASTKLDQSLHNMRVESLIVTELTSRVCVGLGAREAADRGFQVIIAEDACTELTPWHAAIFCSGFWTCAQE